MFFFKEKDSYYREWEGKERERERESESARECRYESKGAIEDGSWGWVGSGQVHFLQL